MNIREPVDITTWPNVIGLIIGLCVVIGFAVALWRT